MAVQLSQVLATARTYLNDDNALIWTDPVLIPKAQEAHRELQTELWVIGSPLVRGQSAQLAIPINASPTNVTTLAPTGYPTDLLVPSSILENASTPTANGWTPVTEFIYLPLNITAAATLGMWSWVEEQLWLAPCTAARTIVIFYRRQIPIPAVNTDPIGVLFGETYLAARTAAIAAGTVGNSAVYQAMTALAKENFGKVVRANRGQQWSPNNPGLDNK